MQDRAVPEIRLRSTNAAPPNPEGGFVLYWMTAFRRVRYNFALQRAVEWAVRLGRPLAVVEALRCDYPWASDRLHRFVVDGMRENAASFQGAGAGYFPYLEPLRGAGKGLIEALASRACVVVTDDYPCFFLPRMIEAAAGRLPVLLEAVDSNGLLPLRAASEPFPTAYAFRRFLQRNLPGHLMAPPIPFPLDGQPRKPFPGWAPDILSRWAPASLDEAGAGDGVGAIPVDHAVQPTGLRGGGDQARHRLEAFLRSGLGRYAEKRNDCDEEAGSGLSPFLHFGHISPHEVFAAVAEAEAWTPLRLAPGGRGGKAGWWGMSAAAEAFLDQLVTWRELGFNTCSHLPAYDRYESLPPWALRTLELHQNDRRTHLYAPEQLEAAVTHDILWNAAQRQLLREGRIHNYLRMLWGKKILEWSPTPRRALETMIHLNNRYALDGRDPNSYTGIFWVLGRHDRPWGPERPIYGTVRYMSSENTARKMRVQRYLARHAPGGSTR